MVSTSLHDAVVLLEHGDADLLLLCFAHGDLPLLLDSDRFQFLSVAPQSLVPVSVRASDHA